MFTRHTDIWSDLTGMYIELLLNFQYSISVKKLLLSDGIYVLFIFNTIICSQSALVKAHQYTIQTVSTNTARLH